MEELTLPDAHPSPKEIMSVLSSIITLLNRSVSDRKVQSDTLFELLDKSEERISATNEMIRLQSTQWVEITKEYITRIDAISENRDALMRFVEEQQKQISAMQATIDRQQEELRVVNNKLDKANERNEILADRMFQIAINSKNPLNNFDIHSGPK